MKPAAPGEDTLPSLDHNAFHISTTLSSPGDKGVIVRGDARRVWEAQLRVKRPAHLLLVPRIKVTNAQAG